MYSVPLRQSVAAVFCLACLNLLSAQPSRIKLINPSFEDMPAAAKQPVGWQDCGFPGETAPDTQMNGLIFSVKTPPKDGGSYLGMVTRDNDSWERVGQRLSKALEPGKSYKFSIWLCRSEQYESQSRVTGNLAQYTNPIILRVWGGSSYCDLGELMGVTNPVSNVKWQEYTFILKPQKVATYIIFEAHYKKGTALPYNGNILVDLASDLVYEEKAVAAVKPPPTPPTGPKPPVKDPKPGVKPPPTGIKPPVKEPNPVVTPTPPPAPVVDGLVRNNMSVGKSLRIDKITFRADSSSITQSSIPALNEIVDFLKKNPDIKIEVGGHTNNKASDAFANKLSTARAKNVADYIVSKGISGSRVTYRGYGKTRPLVPASTAEAQKKNQRVEIKITSMVMDKPKPKN